MHFYRVTKLNETNIFISLLSILKISQHGFRFILAILYVTGKTEGWNNVAESSM
jgi:hypothetical protein